jgi:hypothetical protein
MTRAKIKASTKTPERSGNPEGKTGSLYTIDAYTTPWGSRPLFSPGLGGVEQEKERDSAKKRGP